MKIVEQDAILLKSTKDPENIISNIGRICYKSEGNLNILPQLLSNRHLSVLEHANATIKMITDRGISHELVRHRIASFSQESTRYCNYSKGKFNQEISVINPGFKEETEEYSLWFSSCLFAEKQYLLLIKKGVSPEIARSVLPTCLKTEIIMTANFREWKHVLDLRLFGKTGKPHPQIVQLMKKVFCILNKLSPNIFKDEHLS